MTKHDLAEQSDIILQEPVEGLRFDRRVSNDGYLWWYLDAMSEDRQNALTVIIFIGSVFSPYYRWQRGRQRAVPNDHCAFNIAFYGKGGKRWAMTERGSPALKQNESSLQIGPSRIQWDGECLQLDVSEITFPIPGKLEGCIRLWPEMTNPQGFYLDPESRHGWHPIFPSARVELDFSDARHSWRGHAYFDSNQGERPLEDDFKGWHWSRSQHEDGAVEILYDREYLNGVRNSSRIELTADGKLSTGPASSQVPLPTTSLWRIDRATRGRAEYQNYQIKTLEDTPFYARSSLEYEHNGRPVHGIHESLSMTRFCHPLVQFMLPFRMPRRRG